MAICKTCGGNGLIAVSAPCSKCNGTGEIIVYESDGSERMEICTHCDFGLVFVERTCSACEGTGQV